MPMCLLLFLIPPVLHCPYIYKACCKLCYVELGRLLYRLSAQQQHYMYRRGTPEGGGHFQAIKHKTGLKIEIQVAVSLLKPPHGGFRSPK